MSKLLELEENDNLRIEGFSNAFAPWNHLHVGPSCTILHVLV
jgi:hypothetical protein